MPDSKNNNGWGIYAIRKLIEYAGIGLALWQLGIPAAEKYIEERIIAYEKEHSSSKPFRQLLSEETGIPSDRIHIKFGEWYNSHLNFEKLVDDVTPILEEEKTCIIPRLIVQPNGRVKWRHTDGELYDASVGQDGFHWFYHNHEWKPCKF